MKVQPRKPVTFESMQVVKQNMKINEHQGQLTKCFNSLKHMTQPKVEETLVDNGLLSWAYLEGGTIEAIGCFSCYFFAMWYHYGVTPAFIIKNGATWLSPGDLMYGLAKSGVLVNYK